MEDGNLTTEELIQRAEELERSGHKRDALDHWRAAVHSRESDLRLLCQYGDLAIDLREWSEAEDAYASAIRLAPGWAGPYEALGALYLRRNDSGDLERAQENFQKSLEFERTPHGFTYLGVVQDRLDMRVLARASYDKALDIDPTYEEAYYNLAVTYREEDPQKAIALFEKALEIDPQYQLAHRELGWALNHLNKYREGAQHLRHAIELDDSDGWAHIYLGNLLWGERDFAAAERAFLKATEVWPDDGVPFWCLAMFYDYTGRPREADLFYEKALQLDPDDPQANKRFGLYLKQTGYTAKARTYLKRAMSLDAEDERVRSAIVELDDRDSLTCNTDKPS